MPSIAKELGSLAIRQFTKPGMYAVGGVPGLYLQVLPKGGKTWILRITTGYANDGRQRRQEIGLGGYPGILLAQAREKAREIREKIKSGINPLQERVQQLAEMKAQEAACISFEKAALAYIDSMKSEWKSSAHQSQWSNTLRMYAFPILGELNVRDIETSHIMKVLEPIWIEKTETASRVRGRIEAVLDWSKVRGYRTQANPAQWKGHLDKLLPKPSKVSKPQHFPALPYLRINEFLQDLRTHDGTAARIVELIIYTACRTKEALAATWDEVDFDTGLWSISGERMKMGIDHVIPMNELARNVLIEQYNMRRSKYVFTGEDGEPLSNMATIMLVRGMHEQNFRNGGKGYIDPMIHKPITVHGFRSTFRDWASEVSEYSREISEMALSHTIANKAEAAYRRGILLEKRTRQMDDWARYCSIANGVS